MKAQDLMIGDWVKPQNVDSYFRVGFIGADSIWNYTDTAEWDLDEIEPIPLTKEILEENGWYIQEYELWYWHPMVNFFISLRASGAYLYADQDHDKRDFFCIIHSVHQLQHALRLCGINKEIIL